MSYFAILACSLLVASCNTRYAGENAELQSRTDELESELEQRNAEIVELSADVEELRLSNEALLDRLDRTYEVLEYAETQFISLERGIQQDETKASAVAAIAEGQLALEKKLSNPHRDPEIMDAAKDKLERSDELLNHKRYAASVYFAQRALRLLEQTRGEVQEIRVVSVDSANLRSGPGITFDVVGRLPLGTVLMQIDSNSAWFHVETKNGGNGWIHESVSVAR